MDYLNLVASCNAPNYMRHEKKNDYDPMRFVSPTDEDCESHFEFKYDGRIEGVTERGKYTVELLNLNVYELVQARKQLYKECCTMSQVLGKEYVQTEYVDPKDGKLLPFVDMIQHFFSE